MKEKYEYSCSHPEVMDETQSPRDDRSEPISASHPHIFGTHSKEDVKKVHNDRHLVSLLGC